MRRNPRISHLALGFLCISTLVTGANAAFLPRNFYDAFPFGAGWVGMLPPYNEHLVSDLGGFYLGFAVLFGWAAWKPDLALRRAVAIAWLCVVGLHLVFHLSHLDPFPAADAAAQLVSIALLAVPALVVLLSGGVAAKDRCGPDQTAD